MKLLLVFAKFVLQKRSQKPYHIQGHFPRWLRPYCNKYDVTSHMFPNPDIIISVSLLSVADPEGVQGVHLNPPPCHPYLNIL